MIFSPKKKPQQRQKQDSGFVNKINIERGKMNGSRKENVLFMKTFRDDYFSFLVKCFMRKLSWSIVLIQRNFA